MAFVATKAVRSARIIALPLTRPNPRASLSAHNHNLTYYHFQLSGPAKKSEKGIIGWATTKAANIWAGFGKGAEGSWQVSCLFSAGLGSTPRRSDTPLPGYNLLMLNTRPPLCAA